MSSEWAWGQRDAEDGSGDVCGETYDHAEEVTYEDNDVAQYVCTRCGAELISEKDDAALDGAGVETVEEKP